MYAEFSHDIIPGQHSNDDVLTEILKRFATKPDDQPRLRCDVLSDTFICEIATTEDYEKTNQRLSKLRLDLDEQFSYTFSLRRKGDPIRIRGNHNKPLAQQIIDG
jgi:hypothetical protein